MDAVPKGKELDYSQPAVQGVLFCDKLFWYERYAREHNMTAEERYNYRLEKHPPVLEAFWSWLANQRPAKGFRMEKAVNYVQNRRPHLATYLEDGRCSFSKQPAETMPGKRIWRCERFAFLLVRKPLHSCE